MKEGKRTGQHARCQARLPLSWHRGWELSCSPSLTSASLTDTLGRSTPTGMAAGGSEGDVPLGAVGGTLGAGRGSIQLASPRDVKPFSGATVDCSPWSSGLTAKGEFSPQIWQCLRMEREGWTAHASIVRPL